MKKFLISIGLVVGLCLSSFAGEDISATDINYFWNFKDSKCDSTPFSLKKNLIYEVRDGTLILDKVYRNDAGKAIRLIGQNNDKSEYEIWLMSTYGECRYFDDLILKNKQVKDTDYMYMKDPAYTVGGNNGKQK